MQQRMEIMSVYALITLNMCMIYLYIRNFVHGEIRISRTHTIVGLSWSWSKLSISSSAISSIFKQTDCNYFLGQNLFDLCTNLPNFNKCNKHNTLYLLIQNVCLKTYFNLCFVSTWSTSPILTVCPTSNST